MAEYLLGDAAESLQPDAFRRAWSIDEKLASPGGLTGTPRQAVPPPARRVTMLQHYSADGEARLLEVDTVVLCAGQESEQRLYRELRSRGTAAHLIGGADVAAELDAVRAIDQAVRLAAQI